MEQCHLQPTKAHAISFFNESEALVFATKKNFLVYNEMNMSRKMFHPLGLMGNLHNTRFNPFRLFGAGKFISGPKRTGSYLIIITPIGNQEICNTV